MTSKIFHLIKITSVTLITSALGLEVWNIYLHLHNAILPEKLNFALWFGTIALIAHGMEGLIAAFNASSRDRNPIIYGIYTFFVGFVGLQELFARSSH
ncbi:hypothetical protein I4641_22095 [Waterburya agarophytonicola K14]|uniref:Uncharacterized protein n=1 Tax=Waterburya agarophytonicola KI4 TaxID=2874699 RepID=A0A964BV07_9CYAN|nr:hypothetical protein [Waterburya agarophytonicola]MCC0179649.1 hypothetical protein [Waterburya agarophytonicola KI4]